MGDLVPAAPVQLQRRVPGARVRSYAPLLDQRESEQQAQETAVS
jgi:hypothetical protein